MLSDDAYENNLTGVTTDGTSVNFGCYHDMLTQLAVRDSLCESSHKTCNKRSYKCEIF